MVSHLDLFPTLCDLAGLQHPEYLQGSSLLPLASGETDRLHDELFAEITYHAAYEPQRAVRTDRCKLICRFDAAKAPVLPNTDDGPTKDALVALGWDGWATRRSACTTSSSIPARAAPRPRPALRRRGARPAQAAGAAGWRAPGSSPAGRSRSRRAAARTTRARSRPTSPHAAGLRAAGHGRLIGRWPRRVRSAHGATVDLERDDQPRHDRGARSRCTRPPRARRCASSRCTSPTARASSTSASRNDGNEVPYDDDRQGLRGLRGRVRRARQGGDRRRGRRAQPRSSTSRSSSTRPRSTRSSSTSTYYLGRATTADDAYRLLHDALDRTGPRRDRPLGVPQPRVPRRDPVDRGRARDAHDALPRRARRRRGARHRRAAAQADRARDQDGGHAGRRRCTSRVRPEALHGHLPRARARLHRGQGARARTIEPEPARGAAARPPTT